MTDLLLATCVELPTGEPGAAHLDAALVSRGISARWERWDDPTVDWSSALVAVRSTWDYVERLDEFLGWSRVVPRLLNGADLFEWNTDKSYLSTLSVPHVATRVVDGEEELPSALAEFERAVVKPRTGAGGRGVVVFDGIGGGLPDIDESNLGPGPWLVQPLIESIHTVGEWSCFVFAGRAAGQVRKLPQGTDDIRVHEEFGGTTVPVDPDPALTELAVAAMAEISRDFGRVIDYGRVDALFVDGQWQVSEMELTEPGLYLDVLPENAEPFADMVATRL